MPENGILNLTRSVLTLQVGERVIEIEGEVYSDGAFVASRSSPLRGANGSTVSDQERELAFRVAAEELVKRQMFLELED